MLPVPLCLDALFEECLKLVGSSQNRSFQSTCIREKMHVVRQHSLLFLQISLLLSWFCICTLNSEYVNWQFYVVHSLWRTGYGPLLNILLKLPLSVTPIRIIPVNKRLKNLGRIQFIAKSPSIYTKISLRYKHKTFWRSWRKFSSTTFIANTFC